MVNLFQRLTVFENVQIAVLARMKKNWNLFSKAERMGIEETNRILEAVGIHDKKDYAGASLSHGDRKVLEIAVALGTSPEFLILDEPTAGMSPEETARCIESSTISLKIWTLLSCFCEHDMDIVFSIANRIMVMVRGRTIHHRVPVMR